MSHLRYAVIWCMEHVRGYLYSSVCLPGCQISHPQHDTLKYRNENKLSKYTLSMFNLLTLIISKSAYCKFKSLHSLHPCLCCRKSKEITNTQKILRTKRGNDGKTFTF